MKRKVFLSFILLSFLATSLLIYGQFTVDELTQRGEIEEFLKTAEIVKHDKIPDGVTSPTKLYLKGGEKECCGAWKNPKGKQLGFIEGWQYEIAAYEMDKLLGIHMIPPTVERKFRNKSGSLQFWIDNTINEITRVRKKLKIPGPRYSRWVKQKYLQRAFDSLIGNEDRHQRNILYTEDWRTILIDHSRAFRYTWQFRIQLIFGKNGIQGNKPFRTLPRFFVEKVRSLDYETIKATVGPYLTEEEIDSVLKRQVLLLKEIDEMIKERGEDQVLY